MQASKNKITRYKNLLKHITNWKPYLVFKAVSNKESFNFKLKNSFSIRVRRNMLSAFRECFLDQIYIKHFPKNILDIERPTIVDIGANAGFFSLFMFYLYPKAKVYSFEPMPFNFQVLNKYKSNYPNFDWTLDEKAVSDTNQTITLHASKLDAYTTLASVFDKPTNDKEIEVESLSLQQVITNYNIKRIDILKLDCEGSEYSILYALPKETLKNIKTLMIETHQGSQPDESTGALKLYLEKHGFSLHYLDEGKSGYIWAWRP